MHGTRARPGAAASAARALIALAEQLSPFVRYRVAGDSMSPGYRPGDRLLINRLAFVLRGPRPGEVVVVRDPECPDRLLLKRVVRVEGDRCQVLGDNAAASRDSRHFGPVSRSAIVGKAALRY